ERPDHLSDADVVMLPGTKQTIDDLAWLRRSELASALQAHAGAQRLVVGLCGGLQMLGDKVRDPLGVEGGSDATGLGMLPIDPDLQATKTTVNASVRWSDLHLFGERVGAIEARGYEIHMGETRYLRDAQPFGYLQRAGMPGLVADGAIASDGRVVGTYLHGLFDVDDFRHGFIRAARAACGLTPPIHLAPIAAERDARLNRLASHVARAVDVDALLAWVGLSTHHLAAAESRL